MRPVNFKDANLKLVSPKNWDVKSYGSCDDLFVQRENGIIKSRWKISIKEWMKLLFTRHINLYIRADETQPPVRLSVE